MKIKKQDGPPSELLYFDDELVHTYNIDKTIQLWDKNNVNMIFNKFTVILLTFYIYDILFNLFRFFIFTLL